MTIKKKTSDKILSIASVKLKKGKTKTEKSLGGSGVSQADIDKSTSAKIASKASKKLSDEKTSKEMKKLTASLLSQSKGKKEKLTKK